MIVHPWGAVSYGLGCLNTFFCDAIFMLLSSEKSNRFRCNLGEVVVFVGFVTERPTFVKIDFAATNVDVVFVIRFPGVL